MKKVFMLIFVVGFVVTAKAQFGVRAGYSSANFSNSDFSYAGAFHFGAYYLAKTSGELLSIEPGIQYSGKGYSTVAMGKGDVDEKLGYIDIPVLVRLSIFPALNIFAGPQASVLISRNYSMGNTSSTSLEPVRGYEIGAVAGMGIKISSGFNLQASYDLGLTSLNYFNTDVSNRVLKLSLGYTFGN